MRSSNKSKKYMSMKHGGQILSSTFAKISESVNEGVSANQINTIIIDFLKQNEAEPAFLGYQGFQYACCVSKNDEIVHGLPLEEKIFYDGDIVSIDIGVRYGGYIVDAARTFIIGSIPDSINHLVLTTETAFYKSIEGLSAHSFLGDIGYQMQQYVESENLTIVKDLYSHGVGKTLHEDPLIPNFGKKGTGIQLNEGMTLAIEPMVNMGTKDIVTLPDQWTIATKDGKFSAHYENTIYIHHDSVEILTI